MIAGIFDQYRDIVHDIITVVLGTACYGCRLSGCATELMKLIITLSCCHLPKQWPCEAITVVYREVSKCVGKPL